MIREGSQGQLFAFSETNHRLPFNQKTREDTLVLQQVSEQLSNSIEQWDQDESTESFQQELNFDFKYYYEKIL